MNVQEADKHLIHVYNRNILFDHGEGMYLYDDQGKRYLDMGAGIAVNALGYGNREFNDALKNQIDKLIHVSNLYYTKPAVDAANLVAEASGMDRVFFTNSGAEAIEGALKLAREYRYRKNPESRGEIIAMNSSFHGRTMGALSVTGTKHYRDPFEPLIPGVSFADFNDLDSVKRLVTDDTCAIILEPVQGEGGIHPATEEFITGIRKLCDERDIVMICDEIQCGMGRTGKMYAFQNYGIKPDVITTAKALGCGVPVGAFAAVEKVGDAMQPGDHGTTYGGNPLATAAVCKVFDIFEKHHIVDHVNEIAPYMKEKLQETAQKHRDKVSEVRGLGLIMGMELTGISAGDVIKRCADEGLLLIAAGTSVIRFVPPLVCEKEHVDQMCSILDSVLDQDY